MRYFILHDKNGNIQNGIETSDSTLQINSLEKIEIYDREEFYKIVSNGNDYKIINNEILNK